MYAVKELIKSVNMNIEENCVHAVLDLHGHSKKKYTFIYGPYYQIHHENYFKMRILPKLLSEQTVMFRYFSCRFRLEQNKLKTARIVLFKEFGIMNSFTIESSFHGFLTEERVHQDFTPSNFSSLGRHIGISLIYE